MADISTFSYNRHFLGFLDKNVATRKLLVAICHAHIFAFRFSRSSNSDQKPVSTPTCACIGEFPNRTGIGSSCCLTFYCTVSRSSLTATQIIFVPRCTLPYPPSLDRLDRAAPTGLRAGVRRTILEAPSRAHAALRSRSSRPERHRSKTAVTPLDR